jgi:2-iminobutanoate/2-iminopropanoate deaminase
MKKQIITIPGAPATPYSPAVKAGDFLYVSGQIGIRDRDGNEINTFEGQARQCIQNMERILETAGLSLDDVVKVTVFLRNEGDFNRMNEIFRAHFPQDPPARSTVIAGLLNPEMLIEIECIAYYSSE